MSLRPWVVLFSLFHGYRSFPGILVFCGYDSVGDPFYIILPRVFFLGSI